MGVNARPPLTQRHIAAAAAIRAQQLGDDALHLPRGAPEDPPHPLEADGRIWPEVLHDAPVPDHVEEGGDVGVQVHVKEEVTPEAALEQRQALPVLGAGVMTQDLAHGRHELEREEVGAEEEERSRQGGGGGGG